MFWGGNAAILLALFAFISGFGALNGWILVHGEMPAALAREGVFPKIFARQSKYGPRHVAVHHQRACSRRGADQLQLLDGGGVHQDLAHRHALDLVTYLCCSVAALKLAWQGDLGPKGKSLGVLSVIAILGAIYAIWTIVGAGMEAIYWGIG